MPEHRGNRYGRSEAAREAILQAADDLLAEVGLAAMTMEGLARRAGVGKQTVYRWWPRLTDVLIDVVDRDTKLTFEVPDTGSLADDLTAMTGSLARFLLEDDAGRVLLALRGQAQVDLDFGPKFEEAFFAAHREREETPFRRAIERGELPADFDVATARLVLLGPLYAAAAEGTLDDAVVARALGATLDALSQIKA